MRIVICAAFYPPHRGGYAESVRLLAEGLAERGHAVTVVACDVSRRARGRQFLREENGRGCRICRVPAWNPAWLGESFPLPHPFLFWRELCRVHAEGISVISTHTRFFPSTLIGFLFAKFHRIPVVHTERGSVHTASDNRIVRLFGIIIDHTAGWLVCRNSRAVIGVSDAASAFARHLGARNPVTVHNGIDADFWYLPNESAPVHELFHVAFVGRIVYAKGIQDLFAALAFFPSGTWCVSIVGVGPYRAALEARARELGIAPAVRFCGDLDAYGVRAVLWQADIVVNPSYSEGFPRSVLEAAAAGLPIIATDVGGTREIVENGISGILVSVHDARAIADALRYLLRDESARRRMGTAARARAAAYSVACMVSSYEKNFTAHAVL